MFAFGRSLPCETRPEAAVCLGSRERPEMDLRPMTASGAERSAWGCVAKRWKRSLVGFDARPESGRLGFASGNQSRYVVASLVHCIDNECVSACNFDPLTG